MTTKSIGNIKTIWHVLMISCISIVSWPCSIREKGKSINIIMHALWANVLEIENKQWEPL